MIIPTLALIRYQEQINDAEWEMTQATVYHPWAKARGKLADVIENKRLFLEKLEFEARAAQ